MIDLGHRPAVQESQLRWRWERPIFVVSVILNVMLVIAAILIALRGADWLQQFPLLARRMGQIRLAAVAAVLAPPAIAIGRNVRWGRLRGDSLRLSREQIPEIYEIFEAQCRALGMSWVPELYLSNRISESQSLSAWKRHYIMLRIEHLGAIQENRDVIAFFLARQLGAVRLGHSAWWNEPLLWYVTRIPFISVPVRKAQSVSQDRYGAFLAPAGLRALLLLAVGRNAVSAVNVREYLRQVLECDGFWDRLATIGGEIPPVAKRVKRLIDAGLLELNVNWLEGGMESVSPAAPEWSYRKD